MATEPDVNTVLFNEAPNNNGNETNGPSNNEINSIFSNPNPTINCTDPSQRQQRIIAFNNRKGLTNKLKKKKRKTNKKNSNKKPNRRIDKNDTNYGFNNDITDIEENEIYNSLVKAVSIHNKLSDDELLKIFQNALFKLNAAWFRHNLSSFFSSNIDGDIISLILRLFLLHFELTNTRHNVPFRFLLLDLIAPHLHSRHKHTSYRNTNLMKPLPIITNYHKSCALKIFTLWILEITQNTKDYSHKYKHETKQQNDTDTTTETETDIEITIKMDLFAKYKYKTLQFLDLKEIECLFTVFNLNEIMSHKIRNKICDKICQLLYVHDNAPLAVEWTISFNLQYNIPYQILLLPLLRHQSLLHYALNYIDSIDVRGGGSSVQYVQMVKKFIVSSISELTSLNETDIATTRAIKLLRSWNFDKREFEALILSEIFNFLKWTIHKGHIDDYALLTCDSGSKHCEILKKFIIKQCHAHPTTYQSCIKWAKYWDLDVNNEYVRHAKEWLSSHNINDINNGQKREFIVGFDDLKYCDIMDEKSQIIFVNDVQTLSYAKAVLLSDCIDCIGLDLELMSVQLPIPNVPLHCQILQIATSDMAFIFDLQIIEELDGWDDLLTSIFCESSAVKIGMAWQGDLRNLKKQYPNAIAFKSVCSPYFELATIANFMKSDKQFAELIEIDEKREKKIKNVYSKNKDKEGGLARIVRWVLAKKLNKFEQLSNWSNRPLRRKQLKYAALDAMVQCWLFEKFKLWEKENILSNLNGFYEDLYGQTH